MKNEIKRNLEIEYRVQLVEVLSVVIGFVALGFIIGYGFP